MRAKLSFTAWQVILFHVFAALYLALPTAHHSYDAVAYSLAIDHAVINGSIDRLFHQYHVLYNAIGFVLHTATGWLGFHPIMTFQALNAICGATLLTLLAGMLHSRTGNRWVAVGGALALGGSASFWYYSTNAEPYVPAALALFGSLALLPLEPDVSRPRVRLVASALLFALAVDLHLSVAVLGPLWAAFLVLAHRRSGGLWRGSAFLALASAVSVLPYLFRWMIVDRVSALGGIRAMWLHAVAPQGKSVQLYFLTQKYNPFVEFKALVEAMAPQPPALAVLPIACSAMATIGAWWAWRRRDWTTLLCFASFVALLLFFSSYNLASEKFTVFLAAFLVCAAFLGLGELIRRQPRSELVAPLSAGLALLLGVSSLHGYILPRANEETNPSMVKALAVRETTRPEDAVMIVGAGSEVMLKVYVPYFAARELIILDFLFDSDARPTDHSVARVRERIGGVLARGGTLWVVSDIVDHGADFASFTERTRVTAEDVERALTGLAPGPPKRLAENLVLYPYRAPAAPPHA